MPSAAKEFLTLHLLNSQLLADVLRNCVFVDHEVHGVVGDVGFSHVPDALVVAGLAPRVLHHIVFLAVLIFGDAVDKHSVVVGQFPIVKALLAALLCRSDFGNGATERVDECSLLGLLLPHPFCHVAPL